MISTSYCCYPPDNLLTSYGESCIILSPLGVSSLRTVKVRRRPNFIPNFTTVKFAPKGLHDKIFIGFCRLCKVIPDFLMRALCKRKIWDIPQSRTNSIRVCPCGLSLRSRRIFLSKNPGSRRVSGKITTQIYVHACL